MENKNEDFIKLLKDFNNNNSEIRYYREKSVNSTIEEGKVNFDYYVETDLRRNNVQYIHITFNADTNSIATAKYIKEHIKDIFKFGVYIYILRKKGKNTEIIERIKEAFSPNIPFSIDFIGDIVKTISKNKSGFDNYNNKKSILPKAFINPSIIEKYNNRFNDGKPISASRDYIKKWVENGDNPILVILGGGGVGKTTIAEYFSNNIIEENPFTSCIFINSFEARSRLIENSVLSTTLSLYDIYKASLKEQNIIDEYYFGRNLDCNNVFIIIDGIDELITKVNDFNLQSFVSSFKKYNNIIKGTKIILTCRSEYWYYFDESIKIIELLPFNRSQMEGFFSINFGNNQSKYEKAITLAENFHLNKELNSNNNIYHPYALDLIASIINNNINLREDICTNRLNTKISTDYIFAKMCIRERIIEDKVRVLDLSIDEQIKVLEYIAIIHNGTVSLDEFNEAILFGINNDVEKENEQDLDYESISKSFISHPLLKYNQEKSTISFSYDFFTEVFKSIFLVYNLNNSKISDEIKGDFLNFILDFKFGSQIIRDIKERMIEWNDLNKVNLAQLIEITENTEFENSKKNSIYSGLFNIAFEINSKFSASKIQNKIENTRIINDIFRNKNKVRNLCLINIDENVFFDFSNIICFENCVFVGYTSFWNTHNKWNQNVNFSNCQFKRLGKRPASNVLKWKIDEKYTYFDFYSIRNMDDEFKSQIIEGTTTEEELRKEVSQFILLFIHSFWRRGNFHPQNFDLETNNYMPLTIKFHRLTNLKIDISEFIEICESIDFIEWSYYKDIKKINLNKQYFPDFKKLVQIKDRSEIVEKLENLVFEKLR